RYQAPDGKVPCCVDRRGADRVSEHDSPGAFIWAVAEYYRYTRDVGFLHDLWPQVLRAVDFLATLREQSLGDDFKAPNKAAFYGILPASISHEGYAAYPVHSYWDDFFALRGLKDAADLARVMRGQARGAAGRRREDAPRVDPPGHGAARARLPPGLGGARRLRPDVDQHRARARRRARAPPGAGAGADLRPVLGGVRGAAARRHG